MSHAPLTTDVATLVAWLASESATVPEDQAAHALFDALLDEVPPFLAHVSTDDDADLFLESYDHLRGADPAVRCREIVSSLAARFPDSFTAVVARSAERARHLLTR